MAAKIKICGITNATDGLQAAQLGADLLGFNFYPPSPRYLEPQAAAEIIASLSSRIISVGVFVNAGADSIEKVLNMCPLPMVQLHGDESNEECRQAAALGVQVIKAVRIRQPDDIEALADYDVNMVLLDAFRKELYGGTGHTFDWSWVKQLGDKKIFLAGGVTPANIKEALSLGTYGIDLCSSVEKKPGLKDADKLKLLFENIGNYYRDDY